MDICKKEDPRPLKLARDHYVACHLVEMGKTG